MALGAFLACVEFLGWDGGVIGLKIDNLLHLLVGRAAVVVPPLLVIAGAMIFVNSPLRQVRPLRLGAVIFCASLMLALSSGDTIRVERHGGLAGAYLRIGLEGLIGQIGVSILIALGFLAAVVLVTGASVGVMMRSSGRHVARAAETSARLGAHAGEPSAAYVGRRERKIPRRRCLRHRA